MKHNLSLDGPHPEKMMRLSISLTIASDLIHQYSTITVEFAPVQSKCTASYSSAVEFASDSDETQHIARRSMSRANDETIYIFHDSI